MILGKKLYGFITGSAVLGGGVGAYLYLSKNSETNNKPFQTTKTLKKLKSFENMSDEQINNTKKFFEDLKKEKSDKSFLSSL